MTRSTTSRKRRWQSSQGDVNLDMVGHLEMEGSRCDVIMKKACIYVIWNITTDSFHLYFVMPIHFLQTDWELMYVGNRVRQRFIEGLETFLETVVEYKKPENMSDVHYICCTCVDCCNEKRTWDIEEIHEHLLVRDFMSGYTCWTKNGEYKVAVLEDTDVGGDDDIDQMNHSWTEQNMAREDTNIDCRICSWNTRTSDKYSYLTPSSIYLTIQ
jgi:hypothetical protein